MTDELDPRPEELKQRVWESSSGMNSRPTMTADGCAW
jgi:hypothetical protein